MDKSNFATIHIPHSSTYMPIRLLKQFKLSLGELAEEKSVMVDHYTDDLFRIDANLAERIVFPVCRLVVDPERFLDDSKEPMADLGMGAIYTKTADGRELRRKLSDDERKRLIQQFYLPHQKKVSDTLERAFIQNGKCLLIDCHSFPNKPFPYELTKAKISNARPDICIGTDDYHTPKWLSDLAINLFRDEGLDVSLNQPFTGSYVPASLYRTNKNVFSIMIEINRSLYMDEDASVMKQEFPKVKGIIGRNLERIIEEASNQSESIKKN